jgi:methylglyoxal synthase
MLQSTIRISNLLSFLVQTPQLYHAGKTIISGTTGEVVAGKTGLNADKRRIQELEKQLADSKLDIVLLKKPPLFSCSTIQN